ncbi:hypothetical protein CDD83_5179 [Cordyceps sp. RAO-2017]|nr:hypothetical protein CDD83_5179 [Cordyceps sp. RAO-2017]
MLQQFRASEGELGHPHLGVGGNGAAERPQAYQERIRQVNDEFHAVTELNPDALSIAASLDEERKVKGNAVGPLHGIPILLKDNIATRDKMNNTAGSFLLLGAKVAHDSTVARKLREAGAVILGKANLDE